MLEASGDPGAPTKSTRGRRGRGKKNEVPAGYRVAEIYFERRGGRSIVGNIYKGRVDNVLAGLEAAFVDIGLDKNGFLHVDEIVLPGVEQAKRGRGNGPRITDLLKPGQEIVVQVVKDPLKTKGARLSMELTIAGRYMVYAPTGEGVGVSRRLEDKERDRLRKEAKQLEPGRRRRDHPHGGARRHARGFRARAAVPVQAQRGPRRSGSRTPPAPALVFQEADLSVRVVRDIFSEHFERRDRRRRGPAPPARVLLHAHRARAGRSRRALRRRRPAVRGLRRRPGDQRACSSAAWTCRRGGYLIIDYAEALTVIDVNTGSFTGKGKSRPARGHDHQDEPRGRRGGRAPAAAARHRRHHRHRLHRHGALAQPRGRAEGAAQGARRGPHEDLRGRDLAARPGRDDAPERHRRRARDHDQALPGVPRARASSSPRRRSRSSSPATCATWSRRPARTGPRPTCCGSTRRSRPGSSPTARASCTSSSARPAATSTSRAPTACRWTTSR